MENNNKTKNKSKKFSKKQGIYVALFVCLCVVALVAAITISYRNNVATNPPQSEQLANNEADSSEKPDNSLLVENGDGSDKSVATEDKTIIKVSKSGKSLGEEATASVSNSMNPSFSKPVQGKIARGFADTPVFYETGSNVEEHSYTYKCNFGLDIKTDLGSPVLSAGDGIVEVVGESPKSYGTMVVIDHQNGYKTVYANLDKNVKVKEGDVVKSGDEIGKVGKTTLKTAYEAYGDHLHFAILQGKGTFSELDKQNAYINPEKYVSYEKVVQEEVRDNEESNQTSITSETSETSESTETSETTDENNDNEDQQ